MKSRICFLKKYKSIKSIDDKRGSMMAMVVVSVAALIILASMFIVSAFYNYRLGRTIAYSELGYSGAEAAAERWYGTIRDILTHEDGRYIGIDFPMEYGKEEEYVLSVLERIRVYGEGVDNDDELKEDYHKKLDAPEDEDLVDLIIDSFEPKIRVIGEHERIINVEFGRFEVYDAQRVVSTPEQAEEWGLSESMQVVKAKVGFVLVSQVEGSPGSILSDSNRVFVQKEILVPYYEQIQALGPFYSIGDVVAIGEGDEEHDENDEIDIYGDIYSFGTFPDKISVPEQWAYGGVMASQGARLNVMGSVLTRSFLRAGDYDEDDDSRITVERDVMAQCIQSFSRGSRMYIYGNAYTIDDLEINAEESVIAINGNYIGLEPGYEANFHDQASSILNSGALHERYTNPTESRIIINGDILVPGVSFRINSMGQVEEHGEEDGAIESVGLVFPDHEEVDEPDPDFIIGDGGIPSYRFSQMFPPDNHIYNSYIDFLKNEHPSETFTFNHLGYPTIIQAWDSIQRSSHTDLNDWKDELNDWENEIEQVIVESADDENTYGNLGNTWHSLDNVDDYGFRLRTVEEISGLVVGMVGSNNSLYWDDNLTISGSPDSGKNQFELTELSDNLEEGFRISGFMPSEIQKAFDSDRMNNWVKNGSDLREFDFNQEISKEALYEGDSNDQANAIGGSASIEESLELFWDGFWRPMDASDWDSYMYWAIGEEGEDSSQLFVPDDNEELYRELLLDHEDKINELDPDEHLEVSRRGVLLSLIEKRLNKIASRSFPSTAAAIDAGDIPWDTDVNDDLEHVFRKIRSVDRAGSGVVLYNEEGGQIGKRRINNIPAFDSIDVDDSGASGPYYLIANEDPNLDIVIKNGDEFRGIIVTRGRVIIGRGGTVYGTIFATGRNGNGEGVLDQDGSSNNLNAISIDSYSLEDLNEGDFAGIVLDLNRGSGDPPVIDFYLGNRDEKFDSVIGPQRGRIQLLEKFRDPDPDLDLHPVDLYQIF